jgi:hypothetical protein
MSYDAEDFAEKAENVSVVLYSLFDVDKNDLEKDFPETLSLEEHRGQYPDTAELVTGVQYQGGSKNVFVVESFDRLNEEYLIPTVGEEVTHWLRNSLGTYFAEQMDISDIDQNNDSIDLAQRSVFKDYENNIPNQSEPDYGIDLENTPAKQMMKGMTAEEFLGRVGMHLSKDYIGGEIFDQKSESWGFEGKYLEVSPADLRRAMWEMDVISFEENGFMEFWDDVAHHVAEKAAADQYKEAAEEENLLMKDPERIWLDYNLDDYEQKAIDELR